MASRTVTVGSAGGLHARPAALIVTAAHALPVPVTLCTSGKPVLATSMLAVMALRASFGTQVTIESTGKEAESAVDQIAALIARNLDLPEEPILLQPNILHGVGVSPGRATGPCYRMTAPQTPHQKSAGTTEAMAAKALAALDAVSVKLGQSASKVVNSTAIQILRAQSLMVTDSHLRASVVDATLSGMDAAAALRHAFALQQQAFDLGHRYLADLNELRSKAIAAALGISEPSIPSPGKPFILIAHELSAEQTASLDPTSILAIVTETGGPTSHTSIIARATGMPAVANCSGLTAIADGTTLTVDGQTGAVWIQADPHSRNSKPQQPRPVPTKAASSGPSRTADGHHIALLANVGSIQDLENGTDSTDEGIGLLRTELLFLGRAEMPSQAEQIATYARIFSLNQGKRTVVRTLDSGADKPLPFLNQVAERNPALGIRGLRQARRNPKVLTTQLTAIAAAARQTSADVWVMAPMVATNAEVAGFVAMCRNAGLPRAGVMVEIPSAALQAAAILVECDFISVGTNDLSQYTFAADRECGDLAGLHDPWQPALLELIARCGQAGAASGKPVGLCGHAASIPELVPVLVGLGVTSLSMPASAISGCREALARFSVQECQVLARIALHEPDIAGARGV